MNRRDFLKLLAAGATPVAAAILCGLPVNTLAPSATVTPTVSPQGSLPTATVLPQGNIPTKNVSPLRATPTPGPVPAPDGRLGSNSNYYLSSDCNPIRGLSVTVEVTKDITSDIGFSIQLNCYSPQGANCVYQQYCMLIATSNGSPVKISASAENWPSDSFRQSLNVPAPSDLLNTHNQPMLDVPTATLPAGYKFTISLTTDKDHNVNGATYLIVDEKGKSTKLDIRLESLFVNHISPAKPITSVDLAPIVAFELNLVGPNGGRKTYLSSGAGTITYIAASPLTVLSKVPTCAAVQSVTQEASNIVYSALFAGPSQTIMQPFDTVR